MTHHAAISGIAAIVLAAGESRRYGGPKQLAVHEGRTLLEHVLGRADEAGLSPIVAVVPVWLTRPRSMDAEHLRWVRNPRPERGMSYSLALAVEALSDDTQAALILLGDQPTVPLATIRAVLAGRGERPVTVARADGHDGPPVLLERSHFRLVTEARGDVGLRAVLAARPELVCAVEVPAHAPDIDTPDDLAALR
ncbi:MAG: nucleotidyltransferase family protein [Chloroflexota bacterium]